MIRRFSACLFATALAAGCTLPVETFRAAAYSEIARAQMAAGDPVGARDTAARAVAAIAGTDTADERVFGIPAAAIAQIRAGDLDAAEMTIAKADGSAEGDLARAAYAVALRDAGYPVQAREAAARALEFVIGSPDDTNRGERMVYATWAQGVTGDIRGALVNAESLQNRRLRTGLLALIAEVQLETGDIAGALATADAIGKDRTQSDDEPWLFTRIVRGLAINPVSAFDDLVLHSEMPVKSILLTRIAVAQARAGNRDGARQSFVAALDAAGGAGDSRSQVRSIGTIALDRARTGDAAGAIEMLDDAEQEIAAAASEEAGGTNETPAILHIVRGAIGGQSAVSEHSGGAAELGDEDYFIWAMTHIRLGNVGQAEADLAAAAAHMSGNDLSMLAAAYASLAELRLDLGDRAGARAAAGQSLAIAKRISESTEDKVIGLFFASIALARSGDTTRALEAVVPMQKPSSQ